jgi:hypothetical protein
MSAFIAFVSAKFAEVVIPFGLTLLSMAKDLMLAAGVAILDAAFRYAVKQYTPVNI